MAVRRRLQPDPRVRLVGEIVVDLVEQIKAGEGEFADRERLEFDDVADWIAELSRKFYIVEGLFDQWSGIPLEQALWKRGLRQMRSEHLTKNKSSEMFRNFKDMMFDKRLQLYDWPIPEGEKHCTYVQELLELQATHHSKYITTVEAPNIEGKHDDMSDALVRMIWLASQKLGKPKYMVSSRRNNDGGSIAHRKTRRRIGRGGTSPDRQLPPKKKRW